MSDVMVTQILREAILMVVILSLPVLVVTLIVGLVLGILQATMQIQEQAVVFVPKMLAVFIVIALLTPWYVRMMTEFTGNLYHRIGQLAP